MFATLVPEKAAVPAEIHLREPTRFGRPVTPGEMRGELC